MTDAQFLNGFYFNRFTRRGYCTSDFTTKNACPHHFFAQLLQGTAKITTANQVLTLEPRDLFYIPKGLQYRSYWYPAEDAVIFYSIGFDLFPARERYRLQKITCNPEAQQAWADLTANLTENAQSVGCLYRFIGEVCPQMQTENADKHDAVVAKALDYMHQNDRFAVRDVAAHCGVSESCLFIKFRKYLDQTPIEAYHRIVADKAADLLITTDLSVEEISDRLCFSSASYFRKIFRTQTNQTPTQFRKTNARL